jgi:hypothetical protein
VSDIVSLAVIKQHLRLDGSDTSEDDYLSTLIAAAARLIEIYLDRPLEGAQATLTAEDLVLIGQSVRLVVGTWYRDREGSELPAIVTAMLRPLRKFEDGCDEAP